MTALIREGLLKLPWELTTPWGWWDQNEHSISQIQAKIGSFLDIFNEIKNSIVGFYISKVQEVS